MSPTNPATYHIIVKGFLAPDWAEYLGGLVIAPGSEAGKTTTTLSGEMIDQAALMGVLNNLYGLGFSILSVEYQLENDKEKNYVRQ